MGWRPEETKHELTRVLRRLASHRRCFPPPALSADHVSEILSPRKLMGDSVPRDFTGGWSYRHPLSSTCQDPRLPEGKRVFSGLSDVNLSESINRQTCRNKEALARGSLRTGYFLTASNYCFGVNLTLCFKTSRLCIVLLFYYYYYSS